jgi:pimeloyl-ACP methyl ester carboxylesterase
MIEAVLNIVFGVFAFLGVLIGAAFFWQWFYATPTQQDETLIIRCRDGWRLAIHRYRPQGLTTGLPVILCHGLSSNRYVFDLPGASSLACFLRAQGRDVWVPELRGSGMSDSPGLRASDVPYSWNFDDHLVLDVPTIIDCVLERTGAAATHWIGHSMGGMLILAYLAESPVRPIASAVAVGSPVDISKVTSTSISLLRKLKWLIKRVPIFPMPFLGKAVAPIANWIPNVLIGLFYGPNLRPGTARRVLALAAQIVTSTSLWLEFGRFLDNGVFAPVHGKPYVDGLKNSAVPRFLVGGSKDVMAPPEAVCPSYGPTADPHYARCLIFGKATGSVEHYGHLDLLVGTHAEAEVFPTLAQWMTEHDSPAPAHETQDVKEL